MPTIQTTGLMQLTSDMGSHPDASYPSDRSNNIHKFSPIPSTGGRN